MSLPPTAIMGGVSVLLSNGDGTFQPNQNYPSDAQVAFLAIADLNRDGRPDVVAAAFRNPGASFIAVFLGNGDGTLSARHDVPVVYSPLSLAIADFDQDGNPDVATIGAGSGALFVLRGDGSGSLGAPTLTVDGLFSNSIVASAAADLNFDGKLDLVLGGFSQFGVLFGNGDGTFQAPTFYASGGSPTDRLVAIVDVNGDRKPDLVNGEAVVLNIGPEPPIAIGVEIDPATLNLSAKRRWLTATLELSPPYVASDVEVSSIRLDGTVAVARGADAVEAGGNSLVVKFDWGAVTDLLHPGSDVPITITGVVAGKAFTATDAIRVMERGNGEHSPGPGPLSKTSDVALRASPPGGAAVVEYSLGSADEAWLDVFSVSGRLEERLSVGSSGAGWHTASLQSLPTGIYLIRLTQGKHVDASRAIVIH